MVRKNFLGLQEVFTGDKIGNTMVSAKTTEEEILEQINRIVLLRLKTIIVKNLKNEDMPEFKQIVEKNDPKLLFTFANERIPNLAGKIHEEIKRLTDELKEAS